MRRLSFTAFILPMILLGLSILAFADAPTPLPESSFLTELLALIGGWSGLTGLASAVAVVRVVFTFFRTPLASFSKGWQLAIACLLAVAIVVLEGLASGRALAEIVASSAFGATLQTFTYEVFKKLGWVPQPAVETIGPR